MAAVIFIIIKNGVKKTIDVRILTKGDRLLLLSAAVAHQAIVVFRPCEKINPYCCSANLHHATVPANPIIVVTASIAILTGLINPSDKSRPGIVHGK